MNNVFTDEQRHRLGLNDVQQRDVFKRGWTRDQFKEAFRQQGFTFSGFEKALGLSSSSVSQALTRRYPKVDEKISAFLDVSLHVLWPNQYLCNGKPIDHRYRAELMTDDELKKLNDSVSAVVDYEKYDLNAKRHEQGGGVVSLPPGVMNDD